MNTAARLAPFLLTVLIAREVYAADDDTSAFSATVGAKAWINSWSSWNTLTSGQQEVVPVNSSTRVSVIPVVNLKYQRFFVSFSSLLSTSYSLIQQSQFFNGAYNGVSLDATRREYDANVGYFVIPEIALSVGYKDLRQAFGGSAYEWRGPTVGITATAPIRGGLGLYGGLGYGRFHASLPSNDLNFAINDRLTTDYVVGEFGLTYGLGGMRRIGLKSTALTLGYRAQTATTNNYRLRPNSLNSQTTTVDLKDVTQGLTIGVLARF